jgi:hypothetical protein
MGYDGGACQQQAVFVPAPCSLGWAGPGRAGPSRAGPGRAEPDRAGPGQTMTGVSTITIIVHSTPPTVTRTAVTNSAPVPGHRGPTGLATPPRPSSSPARSPTPTAGARDRPMAGPAREGAGIGDVPAT